jgi:hypothetical protein
MVVVHRAHGFRFVIDTLDHEPAHVHITGAGQAKINLLGFHGDPERASSVGINRSDMAPRGAVEGMGADSWPA